MIDEYYNGWLAFSQKAENPKEKRLPDSSR
jgi:hypothetical protein